MAKRKVGSPMKMFFGMFHEKFTDTNVLVSAFTARGFWEVLKK